MTLPAPPTGLYPEDYERIEAAVMETVRGRWFLMEFARRLRAAETERLAQAIDRLERYVARRAEEREEAPPTDWRLPARLAERAREFARTLRACGVDAALCAQADALAAQFSELLDASPAAGNSAESRLIVPVPAPEREGSETRPVEADRREAAEATLAEVKPAAADRDEPEDDEPDDDEPDDDERDDHDKRPLAAPTLVTPARPTDPRLAALSRLDGLSAREKLRLFG